MYDFKNFYCMTFADFTRCSIPRRDPDYYSFSGSTYWECNNGVIRWSTHWGANINTCHWYLDGRRYYSSKCIAGFCLYKDFFPSECHRDWLWK